MPHPLEDLPTEWVTPSIIREMFNAGQYWQRARRGDLVSVVQDSRHPDPPPRGEPFCTQSEMVLYCTREMRPVALVHQYRRQDGTLGASGQPDPKWLALEDRVVKVARKSRAKPPQP